jgi:cytosine/adenosine deaminase-related metal-dependent hydrolase
MQLFRAAWLLPITDPPIRDGVVAVSGQRVVWRGPASDPGRPQGELHDLGEGVLLPGLVNAHCHLELSHLAPLGAAAATARGRERGPRIAAQAAGRSQVATGDRDDARAAPADGDGGSFVSWVETVVSSRGRHAQPEIVAGARNAIAALEAAGTAALGDVSNTLLHLDALRDSRLYAVVFLELLAWDPSRASATLAWADGLAAERRASLRAGLELRLAAHAPHTVSPDLLRELARRGGPAAIHLAESRAESEFLRDGTGPWPGFLAARGLGHVSFTPAGSTPVAYCDRLGVLHPRLVAAHGVQVDAADRAVLRERGVHVVLCPRSNERLGVGRADVPALLETGVPLALGSDSLASAPSLDVLDDAVALRRQFPALAKPAILRMATLGGAEALGFSELGAIEPGRLARLAYAPASRTPADPETFLLSGDARLEPVRLEPAAGSPAHGAA